MSKYDVKETIVIEIKEDYVIVMDPSGEIHRLKRKDSLAVGDQIFYFDSDRYQAKEKVRHVNFRPLISLVAVAAVLFLFFNLSQNIFGPSEPAYAAISIGTQEGVQVELNDDYEVVRVINRLGEMENESITEGEKLSEITPSLVSLIDESDSLDVLIAISAANADDTNAIEDLVIDELRNAMANNNIVVIKGSMEDYENATQQEVLLGDYQLANANISLWTDEESRVLSAKEKRDRLSGNAEYYNLNQSSERFRELLDSIYNRSEVQELQSFFQGLVTPKPTDNSEFNSEDDWFESFYDEDSYNTNDSVNSSVNTYIEDDDDWDDDDWDDDWDDDDFDDDDWDDWDDDFDDDDD